MKSRFLFVILAVLFLFRIDAFAGEKSGVVKERINSGGYTYLKIADGKDEYWVAAPENNIQTGEKVSYSGGTLMENFFSKTLNRKFEKIIFIEGISQGTKNEAASPHPAPKADAHAVNAANAKDMHVEKLKDGYTVEDLFTKKTELNGKKVKVRGKVVKVSANIMGKNWIHIQDGTGKDKTNDMTFTTTAEGPKVGTIVIAEGILAADKNFGGGYLYPAIVENSTFSE